MPERHRGPAPTPKPAPSLDLYRAKRKADSTPEPFGGEVGTQPHLFVVQKHAARRLHWDLRLEMGGVLRSWAVPRGPSLDPLEKRLAVETEDHPIEYADFEGIIPAGNYGAGAMIVWDRGLRVDHIEIEAGYDAGKLLFELHGHKLRGLWTLVRTKPNPKEWLLIKKPDDWAIATNAEPPYSEASILSGLTIEELRDGHHRAEELSAAAARLGAQRRPVTAAAVELMLAETSARPFSRPGWIFELKYDGYRLLAGREDGHPVLRLRRGGDAARTFPEVARAIAALPFATFLLDGEVVVLDEQARPSFQRLQRRVHLTRAADLARAAIEIPAVYYAFDLLALEGHDLRSLPLVERKQLLRRLLPPEGALRYADHIEEQGAPLFAEVVRAGAEGVMAKRADSPYRAGRSADWQKVRVDRSGDFVVVGWTAAKGTRGGLGALHLAIHEGGSLVYAGRVGSGLSGRDLDAAMARLEPLRRRDAPCVRAVPTRADTWTEPRLVCEVRYKERTEDGHLRHPVFVRWREDKPPGDCVLEPRALAPAAAAPAAPATAGTDPTSPAAPRRVPFTRPEKVFWPEEGYTKGDLIAYYRAVSPWLLPYLRDRPVVLTRYPDGIAGKSFFQKDAPGFVPDWLRTERIWSENAARDIDYFVCDDEESLLFVVNMGSIPLHVWSSRVRTLGRPDWCIVDLDPKGAPFAHVVEIALALRALGEEIGLPTFIKTSGSTGLHVLVPLGGQCTYEQSRSLAELLSRVIVTELPAIATIARSIADREGKVYLDYLQNGHGRLLVAPLSVRPLPGAPVSTPLRWREVGQGLDPRQFTIRNVPARLRRMKDDPLLPVLTTVPDLGTALERLAARTAK